MAVFAPLSSFLFLLQLLGLILSVNVLLFFSSRLGGNSAIKKYKRGCMELLGKLWKDVTSGMRKLVFY